MLDQLFPRNAADTYRGRRLALWLFGIVVALKLGISLATLFNGYQAATVSDGIPLDTYTVAGAQTVLSLFALLGLSLLMFELVSLAVLVRYRALVPLMFLMHLLYHAGRYLVLYARPIARVGTPPGFGINLVILTLIVVGLGLSLRWGEKPA